MGRVEQYLDDAGNVGAARVYVDGSTSADADAPDRRECARRIAAAALAVTRVVPPQFFVGTARHESSYAINERDTEANGDVTYGLFQLSRDDKWGRARMPEKDWLTLDGAVAIFAAVAEYYLAKILDGANAYAQSNGLPSIDPDHPPSDVWAFVAIAHNQGLGSASSGKGALGTIARNGLDWSSPSGYRDRNGDSQNISARRSNGVYGDDAITGGADWDDSFANPFDDSGEPIPAPAVSALASSRIRLGLFAMLALLVLLAVLQRGGPLKVSV